MATREENASTRRYTYGFPGAEFPNEESAISMAKLQYKKIKDEFGSQIKETYDQALVVEETSVYLHLTKVIEE